MLRGLDGNEIVSQRVTFTSHSQRRVDIGALLEAKGSPATSGSIVVMESPDLKGPAIAAQLSITYRGSADPNYIDEDVAMPSMKGSQVLRGVADRMRGSPLLAITSINEATQHVNIECLGDHGSNAARRVELAAGETLITDACADVDTHETDFGTVLGRISEDAHGPVGIALTSDAMPGSFAAFAFAPHGKNGQRFFSAVSFTDPQMTNSSNTIFTGVPVGAAAALLPDGKYTPQLTLANFSKTATHVHVICAQTSGDTPTARNVATLTVPPRSSREITMSGLSGDPGLQNSFEVISDGAPGDLTAKLVSKSDSRLHEVELEGKDEKDMNNGGGHPWSLEDGTESTLLLFNHSDKSQFFNVLISGNNAIWQKAYKLAPMQTSSISIRELIENQAKDDKGHTLPKNAQSGQVSWFVPDVGKGSGRILESNREDAMARNFSCGFPNVLCAVDITFYTTTFADGQTVDYADIEPIVCADGDPQTCKGDESQTQGSGFSTRWSSQYTNIASINGSSTNPTVGLLGMAGGTSLIWGTVQGGNGNCQMGGGGNANVQVPTALRVVQSILNKAASCPSGQAGWSRSVNRAVVDQSGHDIKQANQSIGETVTLNPGQNGLNLGKITTGIGTTDANGQYPDSFYACSPLCPGSNTTTATQTNTDTLPSGGKPYPLTNSTIQYACSYIKINGALTP